jgi:hypothetical protein
MIPVSYTILNEIVRVANGRRFPVLDGHVVFDDVVLGEGKRATRVTGRVVGVDSTLETPIEFTLTITS